MSRRSVQVKALPKGWRKVKLKENESQRSIRVNPSTTKLKDFLSEPIKNGFSPICVGQPTNGTSVTVVLVGRRTCSSRWIRYEIEKSIEIGNGLLGIDVSKIKDFQGNTTERCSQMPQGYPFYLWYKNDGYNNMGDWIERAARQAGR